jgi:hypothetical protein
MRSYKLSSILQLLVKLFPQTVEASHVGAWYAEYHQLTGGASKTAPPVIDDLAIRDEHATYERLGAINIST